MGAEQLYEVSDHGRVRSLDRVIVRRNGALLPRRGQMLTPTPHPPYGHLALRIAGRHSYVHVLVLEAFVGPRPPGQECRHKDGCPGNNRLDNLHWGYPSANTRDAIQHGTHAQARKTHCARHGHLLVEPNLVASSAALGYRGCLACHRASVTVRNASVRRSLTLDHKVEADKHYEIIMEGLSCAS